MGKFLTNKGIPPIMLSASQLAAGAALMVLALPFGGLVAPHWRVDAVGSLLILGILGTGLAYVLNYRLIADEGPTVASTTTYLLPLVAVGLGALVVNETVTLPMIAGMVLVLGGVALVQRRASRTPTEQPSHAEADAATRSGK
jgi:drug/metabolite transporter (DMT)-like permease